MVAMPTRRAASQWPSWTRWAVAAGVVLAALYLGRDPIVSNTFGGRRSQRSRAIPAGTETPGEHARDERCGLSGSRTGLDHDGLLEFALRENSRLRVLFPEPVGRCARFATHALFTPRSQS